MADSPVLHFIRTARNMVPTDSQTLLKLPRNGHPKSKLRIFPTRPRTRRPHTIPNRRQPQKRFYPTTRSRWIQGRTASAAGLGRL